MRKSSLLGVSTRICTLSHIKNVTILKIFLRHTELQYICHAHKLYETCIQDKRREEREGTGREKGKIRVMRNDEQGQRRDGDGWRRDGRMEEGWNWKD